MNPYDDPAVSAGEIAEYLYSPQPQPSQMSTQLEITSSVFWGNSLSLARKMSGEVAIASGRYTTRYGIVELYGENYGKAAKPKPFFCFDFTYEGRVYRCSFDEWLTDGTIRRRAIRFVNECVALAPERAPTQWAYEQACAALEKHRQRADAAEAQVAKVYEVIDKEFDTHHRDSKSNCTPQQAQFYTNCEGAIAMLRMHLEAVVPEPKKE